MTSREIFYSLYDLTDDTPETVVVSDRYVCEFKSIPTMPSRIRQPGHFLPYFTALSDDENSCSRETYANVDVFDKYESKNYVGRLYMRICDDLDGENKYSFMLFLDNDDELAGWRTSISIPASGISIRIERDII